MADKFKPFDTAPVVDVINIKGWRFTKREITIAALMLLLMVITFIVIALYVSKTSEAASDGFENDYCTTKECLETAAYALKLMNSSLDPCDNFFKYACANSKPDIPTGVLIGRSVSQQMKNRNNKIVLDILEKPPSRYTKWTYEEKLHSFYKSCIDDFQREKVLGQPFLEHIVSKLGGWELLGTWDKDNWDFNTILKKVQSDFWVHAFYFTWIPNSFNKKNEVISIEPTVDQIWMKFNKFTRKTNQKLRTEYKKYMRKVVSLLMRDAKIATKVTEEEKTGRLDKFVNDVVSLENKIANAFIDIPASVPSWENQVTIDSLNQETKKVIDWKDQLTYMYRPAQIQGETKVGISSVSYLKKVAEIISSLPEANRKRILHNFLIWRCAEKYSKDLSFEYLIANQDFYKFEGKSGGLQKNCVSNSRSYLKDAVGALFVQQRLDDLSKEKAEDITTNMKKALQSKLDTNTWMDQATKEYAKSKLDKITFKIGYPNWMADYSKVDEMYSDFKVNITDFFGTLLSASQFLRLETVKSFQHSFERQDWKYSVTDAVVSYDYNWNEVIATAGILQDPIYNHDAPHFKTFGSFGTLVGQSLFNTVGESGRRFNKNGQFLYHKSWWSSKSVGAYKKIETCVRSVYSAAYLSKRDSGVYIATINGVRLALKGYQDWIKELGVKEKSLPGIGLSADQMIFLSFAQSHCPTSITRQSELKINMALGQLQEFSDAFQCKPKSKMNHEKKCSYL